MRDAIEAHLKTGSLVLAPYLLSLLADAEGRAGRTTEALDVLAAALKIVEETSACEAEPEIHRLRGSLLLRQGQSLDGEASLQQALAVARDQGNHWSELRAATPLARVLREHGRTTEARDMLSTACAAFTEGLNLPDLVDARTLLSKLTSDTNSNGISPV